jgi:hypothetical protein
MPTVTEIVYLCERCGAQLDTASSNVEYGVKIERLNAMQGPFYVEGIWRLLPFVVLPVGSTDYRCKPKP